MALTGFDPSVVETSVGSVKSAYASFNQAINNDMQNSFFVGMSDKWACTDAQTFFNEVKTKLNMLISASNLTFKSVVDAMNSAAQSWAESTNSAYQSVGFEVTDSILDDTVILENINGVRGIDLETASTTANSALSSISSSASSALSAALQAVSSCGFIGGNQQASLTDSLTHIKTSVEETITSMSDSLNTAISNTVSKYGDTESKVSAAFKGQ